MSFINRRKLDAIVHTSLKAAKIFALTATKNRGRCIRKRFFHESVDSSPGSGDMRLNVCTDRTVLPIHPTLNPFCLSCYGGGGWCKTDAGFHNALGCIFCNMGTVGIVRALGAAAVIPLLLRLWRAFDCTDFHRRNQFSHGIRFRRFLRGIGKK